ncbi:MAG: phage tail sheath family protein [Candidatus Eremiobacteraeota bacterium]|nr:phage tail sheath family protein [Candidatus Eremiobacteraeota bacterium]
MADDTIAPAETGVTAFVGRLPPGKTDNAIAVRSLGDVKQLFGAADKDDPLVASLEDFFANGGDLAFVVADGGAQGSLSGLDHVEFDLLVVPPDAGGRDGAPAILAAAAAYCVQRRAFLICDPPAAWESAERAGNIDAIDTQSLGISADAEDHAAVYFPRLKPAATDDPLSAAAPSGAVAGCLARNDRAQGVWAAPAGPAMTLTATAGPSSALNDGAVRLLNTKGVNVLRALPDGSTVIWGGRTLRAAPRDPYRYVPVRRFALYLERSIARGTQWAQFEPNAEPLWSRVRASVTDFLMTTGVARLWPRPRMGFFVRCDRTTMTQDDLDSGRLVIVVGIAPLQPAQFVEIRIEQIVRPASG